MPFIDVDTAVEVFVNAMPLLDDTDFKTRETSIAYNASGIDLVWNFQTTDGTVTQTAVTPTTGGDYDWTHVGDGMYKIEIPASGGASINNDTEGSGWFEGYVPGVLPWVSLVYTFRSATLNNALVDGTDNLQVDAVEISGDSTAADNLEAAYEGIELGTAQSGAAGTITLAAGANANDDYYIGQIIKLTGGTGSEQARIIEDYNGTTKVATVSPNWATTPDNTTTYVVLPMGVIPGATAPTAAQVADAVWDELQADHTTSSTFGAILQDGAIADDVWDEVTSGHVTGGTYGAMLQSVRTGTAQAGAATTITLDASASANNDAYNRQEIFILSGTGAGQSRVITDYVGSTKVATVDATWETNPSSDSVFQIKDARDVGSSGTSPFSSGDAEQIRYRLGVDGTATEPSTGRPILPTNLFDWGTAQAGSSTSITLRASAPAINDGCNGSIIFIRSGTGAGQINLISDYVGSTKVATVRNTWTTTPDATSEYEVFPSLLNAITAKTDLITTGTELNVTPLATSGSIVTVVQGNDYIAANSSLVFSVPYDGTTLDLSTGYTFKLAFSKQSGIGSGTSSLELSSTGSGASTVAVSNGGTANQTVDFDLLASDYSGFAVDDSNAVTYPNRTELYAYKWEMSACRTSTTTKTVLATGFLSVTAGLTSSC